MVVATGSWESLCICGVVYTVYFQEEAPASRKRKTKKGLKALLRRTAGDEDTCRRNRAIASVLAVL